MRWSGSDTFSTATGLGKVLAASGMCGGYEFGLRLARDQHKEGEFGEWSRRVADSVSRRYTMKRLMNTPIHPQVRIGHVHLTVSNLERALGFYRDVLGFQVTQRFGSSAVFLSAGGYHHHIALNTWSGEGAAPPPPGHTGLYHLAILYPSRRELALAFQRLFGHGVPIDGASDHGVSEAIYLRDPDGNGVELYWDRPASEWPRAGGELRMTTEPLDLDGLLAELHRPCPQRSAEPIPEPARLTSGVA